MNGTDHVPNARGNGLPADRDQDDGDCLTSLLAESGSDLHQARIGLKTTLHRISLAVTGNADTGSLRSLLNELDPRLVDYFRVLAREGDPDAHEMIGLIALTHAHAAARRVCHAHVDYDDCVQESALRITKCLLTEGKSYREIRGQFYTIAKNEFLTLLKANRRRLEKHTGAAVLTPEAEKQPPEADLEMSEALEAIRVLFEKSPNSWSTTDIAKLIQDHLPHIDPERRPRFIRLAKKRVNRLLKIIKENSTIVTTPNLNGRAILVAIPS